MFSENVECFGSNGAFGKPKRFFIQLRVFNEVVDAGQR
jgi:hypothetical protein